MSINGKVLLSQDFVTDLIQAIKHIEYMDLDKGMSDDAVGLYQELEYLLDKYDNEVQVGNYTVDSILALFEDYLDRTPVPNEELEALLEELESI